METAGAIAALKHGTLGPARLRLLPKADALRPIVNLSCRTAVQLPANTFDAPGARSYLRFAAANKVLAPVHAVLKCEIAHASLSACDSPNATMKQPSCNALPHPLERDAQRVAADATVASWGDAHVRLRRFVAAWRSAERPTVVALALDVHRAFDSVRAVLLTRACALCSTDRR